MTRQRQRIACLQARIQVSSSVRAFRRCGHSRWGRSLICWRQGSGGTCDRLRKGKIKRESCWEFRYLVCLFSFQPLRIASPLVYLATLVHLDVGWEPVVQPAQRCAGLQQGGYVSRCFASEGGNASVGARGGAAGVEGDPVGGEAKGDGCSVGCGYG
jgi:hypothetical protein